MSESVENIMLEHLRAIRFQMGRMEEKVDTVAAEILIVRQHMAGLLGGQTLHDAEIASLKNRLERIERRLELVD